MIVPPRSVGVTAVTCAGAPPPDWLVHRLPNVSTVELPYCPALYEALPQDETTVPPVCARAEGAVSAETIATALKIEVLTHDFMFIEYLMPFRPK